MVYLSLEQAKRRLAGRFASPKPTAAAVEPKS